VYRAVPIYRIRPGDIVEHSGKRFTAVNNNFMYGKERLYMTDGNKKISRNTDKVKVVYHQKGIDLINLENLNVYKNKSTS